MSHSFISYMWSWRYISRTDSGMSILSPMDIEPPQDVPLRRNRRNLAHNIASYGPYSINKVIGGITWVPWTWGLKKKILTTYKVAGSPTSMKEPRQPDNDDECKATRPWILLLITDKSQHVTWYTTCFSSNVWAWCSRLKTDLPSWLLPFQDMRLNQFSLAGS